MLQPEALRLPGGVLMATGGATGGAAAAGAVAAAVAAARRAR